MGLRRILDSRLAFVRAPEGLLHRGPDVPLVSRARVVHASREPGFGVHALPLLKKYACTKSSIAFCSAAAMLVNWAPIPRRRSIQAIRASQAMSVLRDGS